MRRALTGLRWLATLPEMHIVALGGGGFAMEPENPLLDDYILSLARNRSPRVCFVPTASGDSESYTLRFFEAFADKDCTPTYLPPFNRKAGNLRDFVIRQDVRTMMGNPIAAQTTSD